MTEELAWQKRLTARKCFTTTSQRPVQWTKEGVEGSLVGEGIKI